MGTNPRVMEIMEDWLEDETGCLKTISMNHHEVHQGHLFCSSFVSAALANDAALSLIITTPTTDLDYPYVHIRAWDLGNANGLAQFQLAELPVASTQIGTTIVALNHNRNSATTANVGILPMLWTTNSTTVMLKDYVVGGSSNQGKATPGVSDGMEFILKPNTAYGLRMVNRSGGASSEASLDLSWYQEAHNIGG